MNSCQYTILATADVMITRRPVFSCVQVVNDASSLTFGRPFTKLANGRHRVNLRSKLLSSPALLSVRLDPKVAATLARHPAAVLLEWLGRLNEFRLR